MAKYSLLTEYLKLQKTNEFFLTLKQIEAIVGFSLPKTTQESSYWANISEKYHQGTPNKAARKAGFRTSMPSGSEKVHFVREST
jgi:hypothetical protein